MALPAEARLSTRLPPWTPTDGVTVHLDRLPIGASATARRSAAAEACLGALPQRATWAWVDGSATGGVIGRRRWGPHRAPRQYNIGTAGGGGEDLLQLPI